MRILVTGAGGFVGKHLLNHLLTFDNATLHGTLFNEAEQRQFDSTGALSVVELHLLDLRDPVAVRELLAQLRPDRIFHLAGQAYVPRSFEAPWETLELNIRPTLNLLETIRDLKLPTRILVVGSADLYGPAQPDLLPLAENTPFMPTSPYSVSKIAQDMLALQYWHAYQIYTVRMRPFNHIGPGQNDRFAISDWALQIATAEVGRRDPVVYVGNLSAARDFTDVRDVVRAYVLALENGSAGEVYNVCSGRAYTMQSILEKLVSFSTRPIEIRVAANRFRPVEIPTLYGDYRRLQACTNWQPSIPIEQSLQDVLNDWRQHIAAQIANTP